MDRYMDQSPVNKKHKQNQPETQEDENSGKEPHIPPMIPMLPPLPHIVSPNYPYSLNPETRYTPAILSNSNAFENPSHQLSALSPSNQEELHCFQNDYDVFNRLTSSNRSNLDEIAGKPSNQASTYNMDPIIFARFSTTPTSHCFTLEPQPNKFQRKSNNTEKRNLQPNPFTIRPNKHNPFPIRKGKATVFLGDGKGQLVEQTTHTVNTVTQTRTSTSNDNLLLSFNVNNNNNNSQQDDTTALINNEIFLEDHLVSKRGNCHVLDDHLEASFSLQLFALSTTRKYTLIFIIQYVSKDGNEYVEKIVSNSFELRSAKSQKPPTKTEFELMEINPKYGLFNEDNEVWIRTRHIKLPTMGMTITFDDIKADIAEIGESVIVVRAPKRSELTTNLKVPVVASFLDGQTRKQSNTLEYEYRQTVPF